METPRRIRQCFKEAISRLGLRDWGAWLDIRTPTAPNVPERFCLLGSRYYVGFSTIVCMAAWSGFCRRVGLFAAVKVDLVRSNIRSVHANARKGATLLWELAFVDDGGDCECGRCR